MHEEDTHKDLDWSAMIVACVRAESRNRTDADIARWDRYE